MKFYFPHDDMYSPQWRLLDLMLALTLPIDRSGVIKDFGFDYTVQTPIPEDTYTNLTFSELVDIQALQISEHKSILVMWSGGIDSTVVIAAFIKLGIKFNVGYTSSTKAEYPWLFNEIKNGKWPQITMVDIGTIKLSNIQDHYHIVTGLLADQLIGGENMFARGGEYASRVRPRLLEDYKTVVPPYILSFFKESINAFPGEVNDFCDFLWWLNFNLKYQSMTHTQISFAGMDTTRPLTFTHFYDGDDFQRWAMSNRKINKEFAVKNDFALYKIESRRYMFDVLHDADYIKTKRKVSSAAAHYGEVIREAGPAVIDKNGEMQLFWKEK